MSVQPLQDKLRKQMKSFDAVSLFSGAMGLDIGLERVGQLLGSNLEPVRARFTVKACVESDEACRQTIMKNVSRGRTRCRSIRLYEDVTKIRNPRSVLEDCGVRGDLPLLVGGPPCQAFSTAGRRRTTNDPRGTLIWEFQRFVKEIRPKFFLVENVRGLLSAAIRHRPIAKRGLGYPPLSPQEQPGSVYHKLISNFEKLGYHVDTFEVNAVNYGTPQLRERVLLIGNKFNFEVDFPPPMFKNPMSNSVEDSILRPFQTLRDAISDIEERKPVLLDFSRRKKHFLAMVPPGGNWRSLPASLRERAMGRAHRAAGGRSGWWRRLSWDLPCPCLMASPNHAGTSLCHPQELRVLSISEYARIQEFPDDWEICGNRTERYRQIGNSVPRRLGEIAGKVIGDHLVAFAKKRQIMPGGPVKPSRRIYLSSQVRTRKWYENGRAIVWNGGKAAEQFGRKAS